MTSIFQVPFTLLQEATLQTNTQVWLLDLNQINAEAVVKYLRILSADEQTRAHNYNREQKRIEFIATRALMRLCLARHLKTSAKLIEFATEKQGKPYVINAPANCFFNLSHSDHLVAFALSSVGAVGVDIEIERSRSFMSIAERYFHSQEVAQLQACEGETQRELFFRFWTLKEAFFKALGGGIATGLNKVQFDLSVPLNPNRKNDSAIKFAFSEELNLQKNEWQFFQTSPCKAVYLAVANHSLAPLDIHWFSGADLFSETI